MSAEKTIEATEQLAQRQESLVTRVTDAHKALEISSLAYKKTWEEWTRLSEQMLPQARSWRMAVDSELKQTLVAFGDIRKFFISPEHELEVKRLREFVDLCERLQKLKEAGFLDRVVDVILKLEGKNNGND